MQFPIELNFLADIVHFVDQLIHGQWGRALITIGLALDAIGAIVLASVLFLTKEEASNRTTTRWGHADDDPKRFSTPAVKGLLRDSKRARWGAAILAFGFALQIIGNWL